MFWQGFAGVFRSGWKHEKAAPKGGCWSGVFFARWFYADEDVIAPLAFELVLPTPRGFGLQPADGVQHLADFVGFVATGDFIAEDGGGYPKFSWSPMASL